MRPIVFFDLETTGTSITEDKIVSFAAMKALRNGEIIAAVKTILVNPTIKIPDAATAVHGITNEMVAEKKPFKAYSKAIYDYFDGCDIGGYNISHFDVPMLAEEFNRCGIHWPTEGVQFIDACTIFKKKHERTLSAAVKVYLNEEHADAHEASADVTATFRVFQAQLIQHLDLAEMDNQELSKYCLGDNAVDPTGKIGLNEQEEFIYLFGKDKGKVIKEHPGFAEWMLTKDFSIITKRIIKQILQ